MDFSPPGSSVHGILQAKYWGGLPFCLQGVFPAQGLNLDLLHCRQIIYRLSYQGRPSERIVKTCSLRHHPYPLTLRSFPYTLGTMKITVSLIALSPDEAQTLSREPLACANVRSCPRRPQAWSCGQPSALLWNGASDLKGREPGAHVVSTNSKTAQQIFKDLSFC